MPFLTAQAQAEPAEPLEEIVVTADAEKQGTSDNQVVADSLVGGSNLKNLLRFEPNVQLGATTGSIFSVRGVSQEGTSVTGSRSNPAVFVIAGGAPQSANSLLVLGSPAWDSVLEPIEAGPVLFGSGPVARGGVIRIEPNAPVFRHEGKFLGEYGDYGIFRLGLTENVVLIDDTLALRVNLSSEGTDNSVDNIPRDDHEYGKTHIDFARAQLRWRPAGNDQSVIDLRIESQRSRGNSFGLATSNANLDLFDRKSLTNTREEVPIDRQVAALRGRFELDPDSWIEGEIAYQNTDGFQLADFDGGPILNWFFKVTLDEENLNGGARFRKQTERMDATLGVYAESSSYRANFRGLGIAPFPTGSRFQSRLAEDVEMLAAFGKLEHETIENVWLTGGVRLDYQTRNQKSKATFAGFPRGTGDVTAESLEWLPELGAEWRKDGLVVGGKISRAYRPAGAAFAAASGLSQEYGAERGWEGTIFAEKQWERLRFESRVFYSKLNGQQVPFAVPGGLPVLDQFIANSGKSTRGGAEIEMQWKGLGSFVAAVSGGYLYTNYDELQIDGIDFSGSKFLDAPELNAGIQLGWTPVTGIFGETLLTWCDTSYSQVRSQELSALEKRLQLSARLGYRWKQAEVYLFGTNLLNEDFALLRQDFSMAGRGVDGKPSTPRAYGVGLTLNW